MPSRQSGASARRPAPRDGPHLSWRSTSVSECLGKSWVPEDDSRQARQSERRGQHRGSFKRSVRVGEITESHVEAGSEDGEGWGEG